MKLFTRRLDNKVRPAPAEITVNNAGNGLSQNDYGPPPHEICIERVIEGIIEGGEQSDVYARSSSHSDVNEQGNIRLRSKEM